ncbi:MAG: SGNH/GDSL hydrolase family protein [Pseudomonadota bacterium]
MSFQYFSGQVRGLRGPGGAASGPLGVDSVGGDEINAADAEGIRVKIDPAKGAFSRSAHASASGKIGGKLAHEIADDDADFAGDPQAAINAASGRDVYVAGVRTKASLDNLMGSKIVGPGRIVVPAPQGGIYQHPQDTYTPDVPVSFNKIALFRLFDRLRVGGTLKMFLYGDSTMATLANGGGYAGASAEPQVLIRRMLEQKGVRIPIDITNRAVGGTKFSDLDAIPDIDTTGGTTDGAIIKYAINDVRSESGSIEADLAAFAATVDAKLTAIRSSSGYAAWQEYFIILVGPTNTFDPQHGRTNIWYERIRDVLVAAAIKHHCFYHDPYSLMPGNIGAMAGKAAGMDDPFGNGQPIHPREVVQTMWVASLVDAMVGYSDLSIYDNRALMALTLQNGWVDYGSDFGGAAYSMDGDGWVSVMGLIKSGTISAGTVIATLPANYRPFSYWLFSCQKSGGDSYGVRVETNGNIVLQDANASATFSSLCGIRFPAR